MSKQEFKEYLERLPEPPQVDWDEVRKTWLEQLEFLCARIEGWLAGFQRQGLLQVTRRTCDLEEEHLGAYQAPSLQIEFKGQIACLEPVGRLVSPTKGRADLVGPTRSARLALVRLDAETPRDMIRVHRLADDAGTGDSEQYVWKLALRPPATGYVLLDEDGFFGALMEVMNA